MVPTITEQVHRVFKRRYEEDCLERERSSGKRVKRKPVPVPVVRVGPDALCANTEYLFMVSEFEYDLASPGFQRSCTARGRLHVAGVPGSTRWQYFADHSRSKDEYLANPYFQVAQEVEGARHQVPPRMRWTCCGR